MDEYQKYKFKHETTKYLKDHIEIGNFKNIKMAAWLGLKETCW